MNVDQERQRLKQEIKRIEAETEDVLKKIENLRVYIASNKTLRPGATNYV
tara:strand:+ start:1654 stop:1803 length:150 start_codon:yes stop_codon:yes gene_type:complete